MKVGNKYMNYISQDLIGAFHDFGIRKDDIILVQGNIKVIQCLQEFYEKRIESCDIIYNSIFEVIGSSGTIIVPTFTYSFCKDEDFDVDSSPSIEGVFAEYIRKRPDAKRSHDPLFSFAAIGPQSHLITNFYGNNSFSHVSSAFNNFYNSNVKFVFFGTDMNIFPAVYYSEQYFSTAYRFDKILSGNIIEKGNKKKIRWIYPTRVNIPQTQPNLDKFHADCLEAGIMRKHLNLPILYGNLKEIIDFYIKKVSETPWRYLMGPECNATAEDIRRTGKQHFDIILPDNRIETIAQALTNLPRNIVSDGYDAALNALAAHFSMNIHSYPTGTHAFTWIVPERWICHSATLKTLDGQKIFSIDDNLLHVVSYSKPFSGTVSKEELLAHLHTPRAPVAQRHPDAIPFVFKYYERDWGLCCSARQKDALTDESYQVHIDSDFSVGAVKVGEIVVKGQTEDCIIFCAHLCHPGQFNDDLSGVLAGLKLMERVASRAHLYYTYRLLILPETIGSACWLADNQKIIPHLKGGIFLEMLATQYPHVFMHSNTPESWFDRLASIVVARENPLNSDVSFLDAPLNDERMFNATGINCPMCSLLRVSSKDAPEWPYIEYHTSLDTCANANFSNLEKSIALLEQLVDAVEADCIPLPLWKGELFVSRFNGLDYARDWKQILDITFSIDGKRCISDIARIKNCDFFEIKRVLDILEQENLIAYENIKHM